MKNAEKFLSLFNEIEKYLAKLHGAGGFVPFSRLITELSGNYKVVEFYKDDLREYAELRNAIVHQSRGELIAEPYPVTVKQLKKILDDLQDPPRALDIASRPVYSCTTEDPVLEVIGEMTEKVYTHIPVYDRKRFIGVFSEGTIVRWVNDFGRRDASLSKKIKIKDLKKCLGQPDDAFNSYRFIAEDSDVFSIQEDFLSFVDERRRLGVLFVTNTGKPKEKILGVITAWDLPKIHELI